MMNPILSSQLSLISNQIRNHFRLKASTFVPLICFLIFSGLTASAVTYTFNVAGDWSVSSNWSGGILPPNPLTNSADIININAECTLNINYTMDDGRLNNNNSFTISNGVTMTINNGAEFYHAGSYFELSGILDIEGYMRINNTGTMTITGTGVLNLNGGNSPNLEYEGSVANSGTINLNNGTIEQDIFNAGANVGLTNSNIFKGEGAITFARGNHQKFNSSGNFTPGASPGCITATNGVSGIAGMVTSGIFTLEVNGTTPCTDFDRYTATGTGSTVTISGTLNASVGGSYTPTHGDVITFIDANSISGTFDTENVPANWTVQYNHPNTGEVSLVYAASTYTFSGTGNWTDVARWSPAYPGTTVPAGPTIINGGIAP